MTSPARPGITCMSHVLPAPPKKLTTGGLCAACSEHVPPAGKAPKVAEAKNVACGFRAAWLALADHGGWTTILHMTYIHFGLPDDLVVIKLAHNAPCLPRQTNYINYHQVSNLRCGAGGPTVSPNNDHLNRQVWQVWQKNGLSQNGYGVTVANEGLFIGIHYKKM